MASKVAMEDNRVAMVVNRVAMVDNKGDSEVKDTVASKVGMATMVVNKLLIPLSHLIHALTASTTSFV